LIVFLLLRAGLTAVLAVILWRLGRRCGCAPGRLRLVAAILAVAAATGGLLLGLPAHHGGAVAVALGRAYGLLAGGAVPAGLAVVFLLAMVGTSWQRAAFRVALRVVALAGGLLLMLVLLAPLAWTQRPATMDNRPGPDGMIRQSTMVTCGPAAGAMLLARAGIDATEGEVALACDCSPMFGTALPSLAGALGRLAAPAGRICRYRRLDYDRLVALRRPALIAIHLVSGLWHVVLVEEATPNGAVLADPLLGARRKSSRATLTGQWDGVAVWLE
jgi:hypothetical protein